MFGKGVFVVALVAFVSFQGTAAVATSHTVEVTAPDPGDVVRGGTVLRARTTGTVLSVRFEWSRYATGPWTLIEGVVTPNADETVWTLQWDSDGIDGPGFIRAVADDGTTEVHDVVDVIFDNLPVVNVTVAPDPFSPNGDGRRERTTIRVESNEPGEAVVTVLDTEDDVRRRWTRNIGGVPLVIEWNGRADGRVLPDGRYRIRARVTDDAGLTGTDLTGVRIDTRRPRLTWLSISPEPLHGQDQMRFRFRTHDIGRIRIRLDIFDRTDRVARRRDTVRSGERSIEWRPRYAGGGKLFPGQYGARLFATDEAGNRKKGRRVPWRVHRDVGGHVYTRLAGAGRRVALTFDDCHTDSAWNSILNTLRNRGVDATFFCNGSQMAGSPGLVRKTVRQGHVLAAHTWDHAQLDGHSPSYTSSRIARDDATAWRLARQTTAPYFRPPYGAYDGSVVAGAASVSHPRVIMWDIDTLDWQNPGSGAIADRAVGPARNGSIILMHTLPQTAAALPSIISRLQSRDLRPVTIAELFEAAGYRSG